MTTFGRKIFESIITAVIVIMAYIAAVIVLVTEQKWLFLAELAAIIVLIALIHFSGRTSSCINLKDRNKPIFYGTLIFCALTFPLVIGIGGFGNESIIGVTALAGIYICLSLALNVTVGFVGLLDLSIAAFYAVGAYSAAILTTTFPQFWWIAWAGIPVAIAAGWLLAIIVGLPALRLRGDYFAIVTLAVTGMVHRFAVNLRGVTRGDLGIHGVPPFKLGSLSLSAPLHIGSLTLPSDVKAYYFIVVIVLIVAYIGYQIHNSRIGRAWVAVREDEIAAQAMGIDTYRFRFLAYLLMASLAAICGALYACIIGSVTPGEFTYMNTVFVMCMVVLGGMGNIKGVMLGAFILYVLPEKFQELGSDRMMYFGLAMVIMMILRPQGFLPSKRRSLELGFERNNR